MNTVPMTIQNQGNFLSLIQTTIEDPDYIREYLWGGTFNEYIKKIEEGKWLSVNIKRTKNFPVQEGDIVSAEFIGQERFDSAMRMAKRHNGMLFDKNKAE